MRRVFRLTHESAQTSAKIEGANDMKYILMMNCPKTGYETFGAWPKKDLQANIAFMIGFDKDLRKEGVLVSAEGLASPQEAKRVRAGKDGAPITDGVFPEAKEYLAGYWIVDVETPEQAYAIAARASAAPGPGGAPMNMPIEVRQVMSGPPEDLL
ncbi:DGPF domain protein [Candidatus Sulfopaludibacter sp. SbA4]|nr:DGPF domain protein [Candidatus Sulfopaludibacter sp. SbA4]